MFELKKLVTALIMPLPFMLIIGIFGLMLVMFTRKQKTGCLFVLTSFIGIFLIAFQPFSSRLLMPLEREYKGFIATKSSIDYVMVLGSAHVVDDEIPPTSELSRTAIMRLAEGIRIQRLYPGSKLILSGYAGATEASNARMMAEVAVALGVSKSDIILFKTAKDTWEEARQAAAFVQTDSLVLVTSASHMKRALEEFEAAGLSPTPAPTNFLAQKKIEQPWIKYTPSAANLEQTEKYWYETVGGLWIELRDHIVNQEEELLQISDNSLEHAKN